MLNDEKEQKGYEASITLLMHESSLTWNRYNVYLAANSVLLASIGILKTSNMDAVLYSVCLTVIGIALCIIWSLLTLRGFDRCDHYFKISRSLENPEVKVLNMLEELSFAGKLGNHKWLSLITISIFLVPYFVFLVT